MITIKQSKPTNYIISTERPEKEGLIIHSYGSSKDEIIGFALNISKTLNAKISVFDLPGHGESIEKLTYDKCLKSLNFAISELKKPSFFIGHSLGARVGFLSKIKTAVAISMPGPAVFKGDKKELLKTLRPRRVKEYAPFGGLEEILSKEISPAPNTLLINAGSDLDSVETLSNLWIKDGINCLTVEKTNHLDIISSKQTYEITTKWLRENL